MSAQHDPLEQRYFEDVNLGDEFEEIQQPTSEHVQQFLGQTGQGRRDDMCASPAVADTG